MYLFISFEGIGKSIPFKSILNIAISDHFTTSEKVTRLPPYTWPCPPPHPHLQYSKSSYAYEGVDSFLI